MPVRKFFNNVFGTILNDGIFALLKKQSKEKNNTKIFTVRGSIKFLANYIKENMPDHEREPDMYDPNENEENF
jgi:hypothetical protein